MFKQLLLYLITIQLNPTFILSNGAGISLNSQIKNVDDTGATEDMWQPIIKSHNWLTVPTALRPTLPMSTAAFWLNRRNQLTTHTIKYNNTSTDTSLNHRNTSRHGGNKDKILTSSTIYRNPQQSSSTAVDKSLKAIKNFPSKSHGYPLIINRNNSSTGSNKYISDTHHYHHLQQAYAIKNNKTKSLYHSVHKPKYIKSQVQDDYRKSSPLPSQHAKNRKYSTPTQFNSNHLANIAEARANYSATTLNDITIYKNIDKNILRGINFQVGTNSEHETDNMSLTKSDDSINNEISIDNKIINDKNHHYQHHYHALLNDSINKKLDKSSDSLITTDANAKAKTDNKEDINCKNLLRETLKNVTGTYGFIEDNIFSQTHRRSDIIEVDDYKDHYNDGNDLQNLNSSSHQVFKDTPMAVTAAIQAAVKKLDSLDVKNMLLSLASTDEIKGRRRQIDKGHTTYTLIKAPSQAAGLLSSSLQDTYKTQNRTDQKALPQSTLSNGDTQARAHLQNLSTNFQIISSIVVPSTTIPPTSSTLLKADTSKGLAAFSSGRKMKKLKKKFEKFLLPLVMAYKLKFLVLIPVLIGGLVLLVGSTGLAGFFFALFTAVMSLKTDHGNAILVKKY